jgi:hypothetical protein
MKPLDFIIIGAQKCATTTLFEHLRQHPQIAMPLEKEVPFFSGPGYRAVDWPQYAQRHFGAATGRLWGKATPQYLCDADAPRRIKALMPQTKLVVILRDPIERTWSHYQMGCRRETEHRDFDAVAAELLQQDGLSRGRQGAVPRHAEGYESEGDFYVAWSEYGRMLQRFARYFGPDQLLVLYAEELQADAAGCLDRLLAFIGLEPGFRPDKLGEVIHRGGGSNRIPHGLRVWLRERRVLYSLWQLLPESRRGRLRFLYEQWNVRRGPAPARRMSAHTEEALREHFAGDLAALARLPVQPPPWLDRYAAGIPA